MPFATLPHSNIVVYYDYLSLDSTATALFPTMLLLHGFAGTPESDFEAQIPLLRPHYNILAPHLYGYGRSSQRSEYVTSYYREDAANMIALLDALHIKQVKVLGFSDGATVGLLMAALYPQRIEALAVLGAQPTINERDVIAIRRWLLEKPLAEEWQAQLAQLHGEPYWRSLPAMYVKGQEALVAAGGVILTEQELVGIQCPTLIMHGVRDRIVSVEYAHTLHAHIPNSRLLIFDAGHPAHLRCQEEYNAAITEFFR